MAVPFYRYGDRMRPGGHPGLRCDNSGRGTLRTPAVGLPAFVELPRTSRFACGTLDWMQPRLTAREIAMMRLMNLLTDRTDWHKVIFGQGDYALQLDQWRQEALEMPLISASAWDWCLKELRDKAVAFQKNRRVGVLDSASVICKSDGAIREDGLASLRREVRALRQAKQNQTPNRPGRCDSVQVVDLVSPNEFPLVFGRTSVLTDGGVVGLETAAEWPGTWRGSVVEAPGRPGWAIDEATISSDLNNQGRFFNNDGQGLPYRWSTKFQWLPCEAEFVDSSGSDDINVRITSYINGLHPTHYKNIYGLVESVIGKVVGMWNQVLTSTLQPLLPPRIRTYGAEWRENRPAWACTDNWAELELQKNSEEYLKVARMVERYLEKPDFMTPQEIRRWGLEIPQDWMAQLGLKEAVKRKEFRTRPFFHPEPGQAYTYEDWIAGNGTRSVIAQYIHTYNKPEPPAQHTSPSVSLQDTRKEQGLQVVVKLTSFELAPADPKSKQGEWHIDGMLNDRIAATAILCFDAENITPYDISFQSEAELWEPDIPAEQYEVWWQHAAFEAVFGFEPGTLSRGRAVQRLGSVRIVGERVAQGRIVAFPNSLHHRLESFSLIDKTRPGHCRLLVMYLVDPHYRVCSTRNVPPQQHQWWAERGLDRVDWASYGLPAELVDSIKREIGEWPMSNEEARQIKATMEIEKSWATEAVQRNVERYTFEEPLTDLLWYDFPPDYDPSGAKLFR